jgi:hypothetical protein
VPGIDGGAETCPPDAPLVPVVPPPPPPPDEPGFVYLCSASCRSRSTCPWSIPSPPADGRVLSGPAPPAPPAAPWWLMPVIASTTCLATCAMEDTCFTRFISFVSEDASLDRKSDSFFA